MDFFLIDVSVLLGVTQTELENGYYFVDLPSVIESKRKQHAAEKLNAIMTLIATNNRGMEDDEYKKYMSAINAEVGFKQQSKFDRDKFDELRTLTQIGGNSVK